MCDGIEHCPDHSDEWGCLMANVTMEKTSLDGQEDDIENSDVQGFEESSLLKIRYV